MALTCSNQGCSKRKCSDGAPLKKCARCQKSAYCSKDCQSANWPTHKGVCPGSRKRLLYPGITFQSRLPSANERSYGEIIDTFRLRVEDDYSHGHHNHSIYGNNDPVNCFNDFLDRCEGVRDMLMPRWWNDETRRQCLALAHTSTSNHYIWHAIEKSDIQEFWKDSSMPMQLRMLGENVYGGGYGMGQQPMPIEYQCLCGGP